MGQTVNQEAARTADTLPAVVFESNGRFLMAEEILIEGIQHFKKRHVPGYVLDLIGNEASR
jgi:hypothetical protein